MSWQMPTNPAGMWNPGIAAGAAMTPDMNMGNYTPDQWTALQQQNWQQWNQWQQQYAQWQTQYGEKYAQQMQAMQAMQVVPPLPVTGAPAPAPPPPDKPPPPPPHENDQPLFGGSQPNTQRNSNIGYNNTNYAGNIVAAETPPEPSKVPVNSEALKKLAEEERLFDIQFQKWEEEIEKWRKENVNHPDQQAYNEYEARFEAARVQLLERRQQMKQRRTRLLGNTAPLANLGPTGNKPSAVPPPQKVQNFKQNVQSQNYNQAPPPVPNQQYSNASPSLSDSSKIKNIDPQDRYESYQNMEDYSAPSSVKSDFLPASGSSKGIPGLDLVPDGDKSAKQQDVSGAPRAPDYNTISKGINNILGDAKIMNMLSMVCGQNAPGSNNQSQNIQSNNVPPANRPSGPMGPYGANAQNYNNIPSNNRNMPPNNQNMPPNHQNMPPNNRNMPPNNRNMPPNNRNMPPNNMNMPPNDMNMSPNNMNMPQNNMNMPPNNMSRAPNNMNMPPSNMNMPPNNMNMPPNNRNMPPNNQNRPPNNMNMPPNNMNMPPNNMNMPPNNQWGNNMPGSRQQPNNGQGLPSLMEMNPFGERRMYNEQNQGQGQVQGQGHTSQDQYYNQNSQYGGNRGPPPMRPPHDMSGQPNMSDQHNGPYDNNVNMYPDENQPPRPKPKWEIPLFTPSIIVEYEHKPLRLKARDFIEPVHLFEYNHKSKDEEYKKKDFEKEVEELFTRKPRRHEEDFFPNRGDRHPRDIPRDMPRDIPRDMPRDIPRDIPRDMLRDIPRDMPRDIPRDIPRDFERRPRDVHPKEYEREVRPRDDYDERPRPENQCFDRRRDDRDRGRREDVSRDQYRERDRERERDRDRERERERDWERDRNREREREFRGTRSISHERERDSRKRGRSRESEVSTQSKKSKENETKPTGEGPKHVVMIDDILELPGRETRPEKIVIILRGPPGSGKSYLAKLIRDREAEYGGAARIMSIDDYFMQEGEMEETDAGTGKIIKKPTLKYEYDESLEETYINSLKRAFKRSLTDGYFNFLIFDACNENLKSYADIWNFARQNGFQVYICTMELDAQVCCKRNIHNRKLEDIEIICSRFFPTPAHHIQLDATTLLQNAAIPDVHMEDVTDDYNEETLTSEVDSSFTSKWEQMDDAQQLARLDGISKPLRPSQLSMEDYLQLDDWTPNKAKPGKKSVRWADIEERRQQEKMRAIGFVVGQTDWNRMTDPTLGSSALTQTKYIERVRRN